MKLKRLVIQGFKSFKDRTTIHFDEGITGIVGPNGCGKSNIVDALFWVMGEQSAKHLRGNSMKDVIFAGSSKYNPGIVSITASLIRYWNDWTTKKHHITGHGYKDEEFPETKRYGLAVLPATAVTRECRGLMVTAISLALTLAAICERPISPSTDSIENKCFMKIPRVFLWG